MTSRVRKGAAQSVVLNPTNHCRDPTQDLVQSNPRTPFYEGFDHKPSLSSESLRFSGVGYAPDAARSVVCNVESAIVTHGYSYRSAPDLSIRLRSKCLPRSHPRRYQRRLDEISRLHSFLDALRSYINLG